jgi:hypothetical protein
LLGCRLLGLSASGGVLLSEEQVEQRCEHNFLS